MNTATDIHGRRFNTGGGMNGRRSRGYSLRRSLELQGVTSEAEIRRHLASIHNILEKEPVRTDITRYRVR